MTYLVIGESMIKPSWLLPGQKDNEFYTNERCYITELLNDSASPGVSIALARVLPGVTTQRHVLRGVHEVYIISGGEGVVEVDAYSHAVTEGDRVIVLPNIAQCITNTGESDLIFYCVCQPRFTRDCYVSLE